MSILCRALALCLSPTHFLSFSHTLSLSLALSLSRRLLRSPLFRVKNFAFDLARDNTQLGFRVWGLGFRVQG